MEHHQPSKEQVREWMREIVESHKPPPDPEVIRSQLWPVQERDRKASLS
ncbi:MAG TPA: hypothetical protein VEC35_01260 [Noviherbaspirillum sp.]|nr:hypothetical protein [Noviherbaspirillum sp.]